MANPITDDLSEEDSEATVDTLHEMREKYKRAEEYWHDDRQAALDDRKFAAGEQWPEDILAKRIQDKRPCLVVDKLLQYVRQTVNDGRQNRPSIKVRPVDGGADIATADVFAGIIKHIEDRSCADIAYDTALDCAATGGSGYFRVATEYAGDDTFDQELVIRRITNPFSILLNPPSENMPDGSPRYGFEIEMMSEEDFEAKYPGKKADDFEDAASDWYGEQVRVARYWCVKEEPRTLYLMVDGTVIPQARYDELKEGGMLEIDALVKDKRNIPKRVVEHSLVSGSEYLEEPVEWLGKYIPIMEVCGNELDVEGKVSRSGIIRPAKDAARLYNYSRSAFAERVALTPRAPWLAAEGQVEDYENEWNTANTENHSVLRYRPVALNGQPVPQPSRISPTDIPAGFAQDMQISEHDIQGAIGMYNASLGAPSNERSGKAIMARQREGDVGTFHYHDNQNRAIRYCGRVLVDLIPKVYDSTRVVRILGYDGKPGEAEINPTMPSASQVLGTKSVYNLGVGTYDVTIGTGPSYSTLRQEAGDAMSRVIETNPDLMPVIGDLLFKNMDWPGSEELSERMKLMLPPPIAEAEKAKKDNPAIPPEIQQQMQMMSQEVQKREEMLGQAAQQMQMMQQELEALKSGEHVKMLEAQIKAKDTEISQFEAETARMLAMSQIEKEQAETQIAAYTAANPPMPTEAPEPMEHEPQMDMAQIIQAIASMQQPINITVPVTVDGKGASVKQGRAIRQPDGSYTMESVETPC
jgi:hypothetical protein